MTSGSSSDFSIGTSGTQSSFEQMNSVLQAIENENKFKGKGLVSLPTNEAQLKHIFSGKDGHLTDTPENRKLLTVLANDMSKYAGTDKYGNSWNIQTNDDGTQLWVRYQNGTINEGGKNKTPRTWNNETGLNNPFIKRKKK